VLVLGMHRSGTSALTGALSHLGLMVPTPNDLVAGRYDNPVHYESQGLTDIDDAVLYALGGTWSAPPVMEPGWERSPAVLDVAGRAGIAARRAFPGDGPVLWKDPRHCLLLPLWRSILPAPVVTVLLWRAPLAVARSLRSRQGFPVSLGLALWERYTRDALAALAGHAVYIMRYEELLADPTASITSAARWLEATVPAAIDTDAAAIARAASSVSGPLARHEGAGDVPDVVREAVGTLTELSGAHDHVPETTPAPAPAWMADVIAQRHDYEELYARYMRYVKWKRRIPFIAVLGDRARRGGNGPGAPPGR
jgi:hypothetical protein